MPEGENSTPNQIVTSIIKPNIDFITSQRLTNVHLNGKNYIPWAKAARVTLKGKGMLGYINGSKPMPAGDNAVREDWDIMDSQVIILISNSLEPQLTEIFCYCETALELWRAIEKQYINQKNQSQIYHLKQEIAQLTQQNRDVPNFIGLVRAKYEELKVYQPPTTDLEVLKERAETEMVYTFLAGLDSSYDSIRAQILLTPEKLSFDEVTAHIRQETDRQVAMGSSDSNPLEPRAMPSPSIARNQEGTATISQVLSRIFQVLTIPIKEREKEESAWFILSSNQIIDTLKRVLRIR